MLKFSLTLLFTVLVGLSFSQDKIILMNGKVLEGKILSADTSIVKYEFQKKNKTKQIEINHYRVYSLAYADGKKVLYYEQDTIMGRNRTVKEMEMFINGEEEAFKNRNKVIPIVYGFIVGGASGFFLPSILSVPIPLVTSLSTLIIPKKINPDKVINKDNIKEPQFVKGYQRVLRSSRMQRALFGSVGGVITGIITKVTLP